MRQFPIAALIAAAVVAAPAPARADLLFTPYAGINFAGSTVDKRTNVGGSLAWLGDSGLGLELDFGFIPDFFEPKDLDIDVFGANNVTTVMANVMFGRNAGGIQPYVSAGAGLLRTRIGSFGELFDEVVTDNGLGVNAGAGLRVGGPRVSLRGDIRYFRNLTDSDELIADDVLGDFSFWRGTVGISFGF
jgi:hypothetical protein